jgi:hypothetical protein
MRTEILSTLLTQGGAPGKDPDRPGRVAGLYFIDSITKKKISISVKSVS